MPQKSGKIGLAVGVLGSLLAVGAGAVARVRADFAIGLLVLGGMVYFVGGFLVVASTDYKRSSPTYWWLFGIRLTFALGAIWTIMGLSGSR